MTKLLQKKMLPKWLRSTCYLQQNWECGLNTWRRLKNRKRGAQKAAKTRWKKKDHRDEARVQRTSEGQRETSREQDKTSVECALPCTLTLLRWKSIGFNMILAHHGFTTSVLGFTLWTSLRITLPVFSSLLNIRALVPLSSATSACRLWWCLFSSSLG